MSARDIVRGALIAARGYLHEAVGMSTYGYFPGGDPRHFSPDPECCTAQELAAHKAACEAWDRGERPDPGGPHKPLPDGSPGWVTVSHYGLGVYSFRDEDAEDVLEQIDAALAAVESEAAE